LRPPGAGFGTLKLGRSILDNLEPILSRVRSVRHVLLALDFDGTLAPIADRPENAALPRATAALLARIVASGHVTLAIVSGRSIADLRRHVELDCIYVGNHGLEIEGRGLSFLHPGAAARRPVLRAACEDLEAAIEGAPGAFVERKGLSATVHVRQVAEPLRETVHIAVQDAMRPYAECLAIVPALEAWEIRPRLAWDKGTALELILRSLGADCRLVICAGDDLTDEHMFRAAPDGVTIHVGNGIESAARYGAAGPAELAAFLAHLVF
jgi:trehalose 6-phosphate phosphatase